MNIKNFAVTMPIKTTRRTKTANMTKDDATFATLRLSGDVMQK